MSFLKVGHSAKHLGTTTLSCYQKVLSCLELLLITLYIGRDQSWQRKLWAEINTSELLLSIHLIKFQILKGSFILTSFT